MRHRFHALCPYFAMFPETFVERWVRRLTEPGDVVLDPFCGRGTSPFQALLMGRNAIGCDVNPVAYCISRAKTCAPAARSVRGRLTRLEKAFEPGDFTAEYAALPPFFHLAYAPTTLRQVLYLRAVLEPFASDVDCMLAALVLGALHGETERSPVFLSNQMPHTIATKPEYSIRFWQARGFTAPRRDAFALLRDRIEYRYASAPPTARGLIVRSDMRKLDDSRGDWPGPVRCVITSPPYFDVTNFEEDQWLRLWFLGGPSHPTRRQVSTDDRYEDATKYWAMIADFWRMLGRTLATDAHVVVRIGARRLTPAELLAGLRETGSASDRRIDLVSNRTNEIRRRQTDAFRPGSTGCKVELDCHFRVH